MEPGTDDGKQPRKPRRKKPRLTLLELAHAALKEANGGELEATTILRDTVLEDLAYVDEICTLIIHRVAMDAKDQTGSTARRRSASTVQNGNPDSVSALAAVIGRSLLNFKLPKGMPILKYATAADIDTAIASYRKTARTMTVRVKWLEAVKDKLAPGQKVGEAIDELTARKLYEQANAE